MNPINHADDDSDAESNPHHPVFHETDAAVLREPQRELDDWIRQLFLFCPPLSDERVDAEHHEHHNQEKESPEQQRFGPNCKIMPCIEGGLPLIKPL